MRSTLFLRSALGLRLLLGLGCSQSTGPAVTLDVAPDSLVLIRNSSVQLSVTALDGDGHLITGVAVSFASNDTAIATVTNVGVVQSHDSLGSTTIRVRGGGATRDLRVGVIATPGSVVIAPPDTMIFQYDTVRFRAAVLDMNGDTIHNLPITWSSTDATIATVSTAGLARSCGRWGVTFVQARYIGLGTQARLAVRDTTILGNRITLGGQPYGAAISSTGVAYVTLGSAAQLARTNLPSQAFAPAVAVGSLPTAAAFHARGTVARVRDRVGRDPGGVAGRRSTPNAGIPGDGRPLVRNAG